ncbi:uncharacterized protein LOC114260062 [Camellia sinensis]|uniref:uncharacterized protein LOC114260062 n=1 Tax=Camellia sinensis TaxID=4442 RepID=UPI00103689C8|nr:uncharacterized protein LOC114260062 [Camellia sinensis]
MAHEGGSSGKLPSDNIGWKFGIPLENNRHKIRCKFCGKELNGGITRLKQHLAHMKGQVASCANVSGEVRTLMMDHLNNYKGKKLDKRKMNEELTEQIRASQCDDDENDKDDLEMVMARQNRASDIEVAPPPGFARRSHSVCETSIGRKWIDTSSPEVQLLDIDVDLHRTKVPTNVVNSKWLEPMLHTIREVGRETKLPTSYEVTEVYLPMEYEALQNWIKSHKSSWAERGVTIMCDGWTADYYLGLMDKVVDEIGEEYVVQIVTDNEATIKVVGYKLMQKKENLYWTGCAAHCIDLMLEDIGKKKSVAKVLDCAKESIVKHKTALQDMFHSPEWKHSKWSKKDDAKEAKQIIQSKDFWTNAADVLKVQEPLLKVLRLVDGDEKPTMGFIYEAMDRAKLAIKQNCRYYIDYWKIIDNRWAFQLHTDLHAAGYFLNPIFQYGEHLSNHREVMSGVRNISLFYNKEDSFGAVLAQRAVKATNPAEWWIHYGTSAPALQKVVVRVLSQTTSSSNCEHNWSTFSLIHTKTRNRLKYKKLNKLVYVYYNMRLKVRHATRKSQDDREESFNPINLDYIFEEDDLLTPWLQEREHAVLDDEDNSVAKYLNTIKEQGLLEVALLSPPSGSGDDSDGSRPPTGGGSGGQWESAGSAHGCRRSTHHIDHDWNRDSTQQRRHSISTPDVEASIGRSRHIDDIYGHRDLRNQFGHLRVRQEDGRGTQH